MAEDYQDARRQFKVRNLLLRHKQHSKTYEFDVRNILIDNNKSSLSCLQLNVSKAYFSLGIFLLQIEYLKLVQS